MAVIPIVLGLTIGVYLLHRYGPKPNTSKDDNKSTKKNSESEKNGKLSEE